MELKKVGWNKVEDNLKSFKNFGIHLKVHASLGYSPEFESDIPKEFTDRVKNIFEITQKEFKGMKTDAYHVTTPHPSFDCARYSAIFNIFGKDGDAKGEIQIYSKYWPMISKPSEKIPRETECKIMLPLEKLLLERTKNTITNIWPHLDKIYSSMDEPEIVKAFHVGDEFNSILRGYKVLESLDLSLEKKPDLDRQE